jgi:hypothetical protein
MQPRDNENLTKNCSYKKLNSDSHK